ncbi:MAG: hypothetical protein ACRCX7_07150 [Cetobacterium sp.]
MKKKLLNIPDELWDSIEAFADKYSMPKSTVILYFLKKAIENAETNAKQK